MSVQVFNHFDSLESFRHDWDELAGIQGLATLTYDWFRCCAENLHGQDELFLICIIDRDRLNAIAPLYRGRQKSQRHLLQLLGSRHLYEPAGLLYRDDDALCSLLSAVSATGYPVLISRSDSHTGIEQPPGRRALKGLLHRIASPGSQHLRIAGEFEQFEKGLASKRRYDLRRADRKAAEYGEVGYEICPARPENIDEMLHRAMAIENTGWKKHRGSSMAENQALGAFFRGLFRGAAQQDQAVFGFLLVDQQPIACNLSLLWNRRLWTLKIGYHADYHGCSPGTLLTHRMIRYAYENGLEGFEFLGSSERWIDLWKPDTREYISYLYYPMSVNGIRGLTLDAASLVKRRLSQIIKK